MVLLGLEVHAQCGTLVGRTSCIRKGSGFEGMWELCFYSTATQWLQISYTSDTSYNCEQIPNHRKPRPAHFREALSSVDRSQAGGQGWLRKESGPE